eukprot:GHVR01101951.1.p1 GENE.GHVR01101951.1~~GHVR01101951.1.p1  ORF type:complete len:140 (+),score=11.79 GHVR01101951.1:2979-3398(+)
MEIKRGFVKSQIGSKVRVEMIDEEDESSGPVDILLSYDEKWVDKVLGIQKWKEKKNILEEFIKRTKASSILPRDNSHYITLIKRLMTDNNINLLQCGFKIMKNLCKGLKKHFHHSAKAIMSFIFVKLKDGKAMIVDEAQ